MSAAPQPCSWSFSRRLGRLPATGTVSRCPANSTREDRFSFVRASTALPLRMISNPDA
ncbi:Uncharacterised protein [Mycobacterium tuberculosis]|uniref:Uncharacterized protein n=1 Tax=Mycobacterium tuberculosis TaxID=1773 RepID=A0A0U0SYX7_MYCTX|nr:Uncharacterised protein [Mycobacterium tuberculosis]CFR84512.1 Uncharacterised protein [Mycobacterium tuberculosis]CKP60033.1 Uncharacterised protein [Mycobacterium tuberculosis]CKQ22934.1 Uncharacterised protein [Mycobacterium tuberculosis]CKS10347.1 Uncharacterised protein [Mycobacterium tuberculosis]